MLQKQAQRIDESMASVEERRGFVEAPPPRVDLGEPARQNQLSTVLKTALGDIPLVGAYTFGQLARPVLDKTPVLHNQNLEVLVFGEGHE